MKKLTILAMLLLCCSTQAEVTSHYTTTHYSFNARDVEDLVQKIKSKGPKIGSKTAWAIINWNLTTQYSFSSTEQGCNIVVEDMEVLANVVLPNCKNIKNKKADIQNWWKEYYAFMEKHEDLHFESALTSAKDFEQKLFEMEEQPDCKKVRYKYLMLKKEFLDNVNLVDKSIDKNTSQQFYTNVKLFSPLKKFSPIVFESGGMSSFIR